MTGQVAASLEPVPGYAWGTRADGEDRGVPVDGPVFRGPERGGASTLRRAAAYLNLVQCAHCGGIYDMGTVKRTAFYPVYHQWEAPCCGQLVADAGGDFRLVLLWPEPEAGTTAAGRAAAEGRLPGDPGQAGGSGDAAG